MLLLSSLLKNLKNITNYELFGNLDIKVSGITDNSKKVKKNSVFVAIKGLNVDGYDFIPQAITNGASVIVSERKPKRSWLKKVSYLRVGDARLFLSLLASSFYGNPSEKMKVIGVTGTDGKTTTVSAIYHLLKSSGKNVGLVTTVAARIGNRKIDTGLHVTNPEPLALQKLLYEMVKEGCEFAVLEVTSHGIDQKRVGGIDFETAVLTNVTREHLDYHKTFSNYRATKLKLFKNVKSAVINRDDKSFDYFRRHLDKNTKVISYSLNKAATYRAKDVKILKNRMIFKVFDGRKGHLVSTKILGSYNVSNLLAAISVAREYKVGWKSIKKSISKFEAPEGRLQEVKNDRGIKIYIDFAHTPNALRELLGFLKSRVKRKLIVVTGAEGLRDKGKRPLMGKIASEIADYVVVTAVDPRIESAEEINKQVIGGVKKYNLHKIFNIPDRLEAIKYAINKIAEKGDTVVVCGKGHEKSLNINGVELPWSETKAVKSALDSFVHLDKVKSVHFCGIKGVGMTSLAICAKDLGLKVGGSDTSEYFVTDETLQSKGIKWSVGFGPQNLKRLPDLLITTGAHGGLNNPEVVYAREKEVPIMTHAEALGRFSADKDVIAVCGVGGKTTTSSMIATVLQLTGREPSFAIGVGNIYPLVTPGKFSRKGKYFICEADEFAVSPGIDNRPRFSYLSPKILVVTNIEHDHPDVYPTFRDTQRVYLEFFRRIPKDGLLVASNDNRNTRELIKHSGVKTQTYGFRRGSDWRIFNVRYSNGRTYFSVEHKGKVMKDIIINVPGEYNVKNATAAIVVSMSLGIGVQEIRRGLAGYLGCRRRFEKMGVFKGAIFYDDYAHHPEEIQAVLKAARDWFPRKRILAIFQPHTYSRTKALLGEFAKAFGDADVVAIMDIYASARESFDPTISSQKLVAEIGKNHSLVFYTGDSKNTLDWIHKNVRDGDVFLTLGAGDIFRIYKELF